MAFEPLCIGIKRGVHRVNDARAKQADAVFEVRRSQALHEASYRCMRCGYESSDDVKRHKKSGLHVHHQDNDHHNNEPDNHLSLCSLDHAYHHIGCDAPTPGGSRGWASQMVIGFIPELTAEDANQLQRALGAALLDAGEAEIAKEIVGLLGITATAVKDSLGTFQAKDFAAAFGSMSEVEYEKRDQAIAGFRVLFHPNILTQVGKEMLEDASLFPVKAWEGVSRGFGV